MILEDRLKPHQRNLHLLDYLLKITFHHQLLLIASTKKIIVLEHHTKHRMNMHEVIIKDSM